MPPLPLTVSALVVAFDPRCPTAYRSPAAVASTPSLPNPLSSWVHCQRSGDQARGMVLQQQTPLMVATTYNSLDVMRQIVAIGPTVNVNRSCFPYSMALHYAASGGSLDAVKAIWMLLVIDADVSVIDSRGHSPLDDVVSPPKLQSQKLALSKLHAAVVDAPDCLIMAMVAVDAAHTTDELCPLYVSTDSTVPSPRSSMSAMEMVVAAMPGLVVVGLCDVSVSVHAAHVVVSDEREGSGRLPHPLPST